MSPDTALALIGFAFVMSISPGPANFMLLASGANFGFRRSLPLVFGISLGFLTMVFCVGVGLGEVMRQVPLVYTVLKFACAAYVLWLTLKIGRSRSLGSADGSASATPISFVQAALFQLLNPKAWAVALIVTVSFTDPADYLRSLLLMIALFALVNLLSISVWAVSGICCEARWRPAAGWRCSIWRWRCCWSVRWSQCCSALPEFQSENRNSLQNRSE